MTSWPSSLFRLTIQHSSLPSTGVIPPSNSPCLAQTPPAPSLTSLFLYHLLASPLTFTRNPLTPINTSVPHRPTPNIPSPPSFIVEPPASGGFAQQRGHTHGAPRNFQNTLKPVGMTPLLSNPSLRRWPRRTAKPSSPPL